MTQFFFDDPLEVIKRWEERRRIRSQPAVDEKAWAGLESVAAGFVHRLSNDAAKPSAFDARVERLLIQPGR